MLWRFLEGVPAYIRHTSGFCRVVSARMPTRETVNHNCAAASIVYRTRCCNLMPRVALAAAYAGTMPEIWRTN
jgi:hypothetical protein